MQDSCIGRENSEAAAKRLVFRWSSRAGMRSPRTDGTGGVLRVSGLIRSARRSPTWPPSWCRPRTSARLRPRSATAQHLPRGMHHRSRRPGSPVLDGRRWQRGILRCGGRCCGVGGCRRGRALMDSGILEPLSRCAAPARGAPSRRAPRTAKRLHRTGGRSQCHPLCAPCLAEYRGTVTGISGSPPSRLVVRSAAASPPWSRPTGPVATPAGARANGPPVRVVNGRRHPVGRQRPGCCREGPTRR